MDSVNVRNNEREREKKTPKNVCLKMVHSTFSTPYTQMVFGVNVCDTLKVRLIYWKNSQCEFKPYT